MQCDWRNAELLRLHACLLCRRVITPGESSHSWRFSGLFHRYVFVCYQFWAAYVPCDAQHRDAVQLTFEQIDLIQRLTDKYHPQLTLCTSADGKIRNSMKIITFSSIEKKSYNLLKTLFIKSVKQPQNVPSLDFCNLSMHKYTKQV